MPFQEYLTGIEQRSPGTAQTWKKVLLKWAKNIGYDSPDAVVADIKSKADVTTRAIEILNKSVSFYCRQGPDGQRKLRSKTINNYFHAIKGFFEYEDIELPETKLKKITRAMPRVCKESYDRAPTPEEVRKIVGHAGAKAKAAILMLASSGLRIGELKQLKVDHIDVNNKPTKIIVEAVHTKTRQPRITFITEEATNALKDYLGERFNDSDSLIFLLPDGRPTTEQALRKQIGRAIDKAGLKKKKTGSFTNEIHVHCFRKFFKTRLTNAEMPDVITETLMGHLNQNDRSYDRTTEEELAEAYLKFGESALTISSREPKDLRESMEWVKQQQEEQDKAQEGMRQQFKQLQDELNRIRDEIRSLPPEALRGIVEVHSKPFVRPPKIKEG